MSVCETCAPAYDAWLIQPFAGWANIRFRTHDGESQLDVLQMGREERWAIKRRNLDIIETNCANGNHHKNTREAP